MTRQVVGPAGILKRPQTRDLSWKLEDEGRVLGKAYSAPGPRYEKDLAESLC